MQEHETAIELTGLNHLEAAELKADLKQAGADPADSLSVQRVNDDVSGRTGVHGDPFTVMAVLAVSQVALTGLAVYLAKGRKDATQILRIRHTKPGGEELRYELVVNTHSEDAIRADLMKQIGALHIPLPKGALTESQND